MGARTNQRTRSSLAAYAASGRVSDDGSSLGIRSEHTAVTPVGPPSPRGHLPRLICALAWPTWVAPYLVFTVRTHGGMPAVTFTMTRRLCSSFCRERAGPAAAKKAPCRQPGVAVAAEAAVNGPHWGPSARRLSPGRSCRARGSRRDSTQSRCRPARRGQPAATGQIPLRADACRPPRRRYRPYDGEGRGCSARRRPRL